MDISPCRFIHSALLRRVANEIEHQHCHFATACLVMENSRAAKDMSSATPAAFAALPPARLSRENYFRRQGSVCARRQGAARQVPTCSGETPRLPRGFGKGRPANGKAMGKGDGEVGFVGADHLGISFTCGVCETRVAKSIRRKSYEEGVCLVQCPGCKKHHGLTGKGSTNVEELAREKGENFTRVNSDVFELEKLVARPPEDGSDAVSEPSSTDGN